ncbi:MAG: Na/Pi cotransporter family protein [Planctomycetota bacterium]|nr:MAG: Na/Pi cotransporter family protein [Planctomycetota bacterium]
MRGPVGACRSTRGRPSLAFNTQHAKTLNAIDQEIGGPGDKLYAAGQGVCLSVVRSCLLSPLPAGGHAVDEQGISWATMIMGLAGGLALFLHGMTMMSTALKAMAGSQLKTIMARLTGNRLAAVATGCVATAVVQSSSITTVIAIGFVSAGIISLTQAIGVILGAAVGTTVTAQIIAFKVTHYAFLLIAGGFIATMLRGRPTVSRVGAMVMGLGVIFLGLDLMSSHMAPLRSHQPFLDLMARMENPLLGIIIGAVFTALVQSSSATLGVIIALSAQGLIPLYAGLALVFGANVGTTITAMLATIGQPRAALHTALSYVAFKLIMVLIWLPLLGPLEQFTRAISPTAEHLDESDRLAYEVPRQVANAHTIINLGTVIILLPFTGALAWVVIRLSGPGRRQEEDENVAPDLNPILLEQPTLAVDATRREVVHLGERVARHLEQSMIAIIDGGEARLQALRQEDDRIDRHHEALVEYVERLLQPELPPKTGMEAMHLLEAADYLESIGDVIDKDMIPLGLRRVERDLQISEETQTRIHALSEAVVQVLRESLRAIASNDEQAADSVNASKPEIRALERQVIEHQFRRLQADAAKRVTAYTIERDITEALRRIYSLTRRSARAGCGSSVVRRYEEENIAENT